MSEGCRQFRRQLFDKIIDALQARALTEFWRATPGWDARQGALSMIAPNRARPPKPESINVPLRDIDPLSRDGANLRNALLVAAIDVRQCGVQRWNRTGVQAGSMIEAR